MKKIYISIHSGYSLDMTTSSTPPSFPPPLLHVLTPGSRASAECWQGGILEGRRHCFVLIKGLCKFTAMNKSPPGPMSPSFPPLQKLLWFSPSPAADAHSHPGCPSARGRADRDNTAPRAGFLLQTGVWETFPATSHLQGFGQLGSWENAILQTQGGGRVSIIPLGSLWGSDLATWSGVLMLSQAGYPGSAAPFLKVRCS